MTSEVFVSVVAPVRVPGDVLEAFVAETVVVLQRDFRYHELVLVDDGTEAIPGPVRDSMLSRYDGLRIVTLSRDFGEEQAFAAGLDSAIGDFVVTILPGIDPPALLPALVQHARNGFDVVICARRSRAGDPWWLRMGVGIFHWYSRRVLRLELPLNATHFRCLSRAALNALNKLRLTGSRLRVFSTFIGYSSVTVLYDQLPSLRQSRSRTFVQALRIALSLVLDNTLHPLRLVSLMGVSAALLNFLYAGYVVAVYALLPGVAPGWLSISLTTAVQFFFISLILAILCEYVGRLSERGAHPGYFVRDEYSSAVMLREDRPNVTTEA